MTHELPGRAFLTSKESPHRRGQTSFSAAGRDLIGASEDGSTAGVAVSIRMAIAARCPGSAKCSHGPAGWLVGGRRTQGAVQRPARTGAQRTEAEGAQRSPEVAARRAGRDQLGWLV